MKKEELCRGILSQFGGSCSVGHNVGWYNRHALSNIKRIRMKCPDCGRRIMSSITNCHDGCCFWHVLPPHKPKDWWKKGKQRPRNKPEKQLKRI